VSRTRAIAFVGLVALAAAGAACGRDGAPEPAGAPAAGSDAADAAARSAAAARLVDHRKLDALVPAAAAGWASSPVTSATLMLPAPASHATGSYTRGQARIDLEITDTGGDPAFVQALATVAGTNFSQKAGNGYMKGTRVHEYPAVESWNHQDRIGEITVLVSGRFVVHASGVNLDRIETLQALVDRVDFGQVAALK